MTLPPVEGHERLRTSIARAIHGGTLPRALLLHGPRGVGKQRIAFWAGQTLLCEDRSPSGPCGVCRSCRLSLRLEHPDLSWYFPIRRPPPKGSRERDQEAQEEERAEGLARAREVPLRPSHSEDPLGLYLGTVRNLKREATRGPALGPARLFVVAEAQELVSQEASPEAANALLKLLEEPPERCSLVLTASEPGRLLPTIRSRTSDLYVPPLPSHQVREFLSRHLDASAEEIGKATSLCGGSIGRALGYLPSEGERGPLERARQEAFHLLRAALSPDSADGFERSLSYPPAGARGLHELLSALECWLRDLSAVASWERAPVLNEDARSWLIEAARREQIDPRRAAECIQFVENARGLASGNVNPQLILSRMLAEIRNGLRDSSPVPGEVS